MNMYKVRIDNFDLEQVAKSGQCFRWIKNGENTYNIAAFGREVDITQNGNEFTLSCDEDEWNNIWRDYLDIDTDYGKIAKLIEEGVNNTEIMEKVFNENLFHYPTEKTIKKVFVRHV